MKYCEVAKRLKALGCEEISRKKPGSHRIWYNSDTGRLASLPDWGSEDLKIGTLHAAIRQLGLELKDFLGT